MRRSLIVVSLGVILCEVRHIGARLGLVVLGLEQE